MNFSLYCNALLKFPQGFYYIFVSVARILYQAVANCITPPPIFMKKLTLTFIVALVHFCVLAQNSINIIPAPQQWNPTGSQIHFKAIHVKFPSDINNKEQLLLHRFKLELIDLEIPLVDAPGDSVLNLEFDTAYLNIKAQEDAYQIELGRNTAIKADSYNGLVHTTRTLLQLFSQDN